MTVKIKILSKPAPDKEIKPTLRQQAVVAMVGNGRMTSKRKILSAAGYSKAIQDVPSKVFNAPFVARKVADVIKTMEEERDEIYKAMKKKRGKANYVALSIAAKNMTHDIELLAGRPTERPDDALDAPERQKLREIMARNRRK